MGCEGLKVGICSEASMGDGNGNVKNAGMGS